MRNNPEVRRQMFDMIEQWQQSGLTKKAYCDQQSIKTTPFIIGINDTGSSMHVRIIKVPLL